LEVPNAKGDTTVLKDIYPGFAKKWNRIKVKNPA